MKQLLVDRALAGVALGQEPADVVIRDAQVVNVATAEIAPADVAIRNGRIAYVGDVGHCIGPNTVTHSFPGRYLSPGLIDPHFHPEAAKLTLTSLAEALVPLGTTTVFGAMDETFAVTGEEGVRFVLEESRGTPLRVVYHPYAHIPITGIEPASTPRHIFDAHALARVLDWPDTVGTMDTVIDWVLSFSDDVVAKMSAMQERGLLVHGHDPLETGPRLQAFLTTGIRSDHVPHSAAEALEKLRAGMWVMFCDGPIHRVLPEAIKAITETGISSRHATFCIDDMEARDAYDLGHIDHQVRTVIEAGMSPVEAIQMATLNAAECHRMDHLLGSIAPGRSADILVVEDLHDFRAKVVFSAGTEVARDGQMLQRLSRPEYPRNFRQTFNLAKLPTADDLVLHVPAEASSARVLALQVGPETPMRKRNDVTLPIEDGVVQADVERDILHCAIVERHHGTGNIGRAFVSGFGLNGGTFASSLGSPTCNITCIGSDPEDMAIAIRHLVDIDGGQVLVKDGQVVESLPLPLGGFMTDEAPEVVAAQERALGDRLTEWGCPISRPLLFAAFLEIVPLPHYAITEHGVVEFSSLSYVDPILEVQ